MSDYRRDFPLLMQNKVIYLDNAATSQRPQCVIDAEMDYYINHNANPLRGSYDLSIEATDIYENARIATQKFINAKSETEIIFTRNTSESINLVAYSYGLNFVGEGDEILVSIMEHHSNMLPWQMVSKKTGAILKYIDCEMDGRLDMKKVESLITDKTKIVAINQVSNVLGRVNPIKEIASLVHKHGGIIVVDGAQSTPHMKVDVQDLDADFLAFSGHKLLGPMGIGVLYGRKELLEKMPPFLSGGEMIESVSRFDAKFAELPHKFEAGTVNGAGAAGLKAAIEYINKVGFEYMEAEELKLTKRALDGLFNIPHINVFGSKNPAEHTGIVTFTVDQVHPHDVSEVLSEDGIAIRAGHHCAQPLLQHLGVNSTSRASFMFYNTEAEIDAFIESVSTIRERLGYGK